jgi:hypothetical protein
MDENRVRKPREKLSIIDSWVMRLKSEKFDIKAIADWFLQARDRNSIVFPQDFYGETFAIQDEVIYRVSCADTLSVNVGS